MCAGQNVSRGLGDAGATGWGGKPRPCRTVSFTVCAYAKVVTRELGDMSLRSMYSYRTVV